MKNIFPYFVGIVLLTPTLLFSQGKTSKKIEVIFNRETRKELAAKKHLLQLLEKYDLSRWTFTDTVAIEYGVIPHSHPVLTLHTRHLNDDLRLLSTLIHEQIHWFISEKSQDREKAIAELRTIFPVVPVGNPAGARNEYSTYLHLIVCYLEYEGMKELVGEKKARAIMRSWSHYYWIYDMVVNQGSKIKSVIDKYNLNI